MKTQLQVRFLMFLCFVPIVLISCSKKDDMSNPVTVPHVNQPATTPIGSIVDSGAINVSTRVMKMKLNTQTITLYGSNDDVSYAPAKVTVVFYVNNDGIIPSGTYSYSSDAVKTPYTFDSAILNYQTGSDVTSSVQDRIVDGAIDVNQQGDIYQFSLQISLASGLTASQIYSGPVDYADANN